MAQSVTETGFQPSTPSFLAQEQADGQRIEAVLIFEASTGVATS